MNELQSAIKRSSFSLTIYTALAVVLLIAGVLITFILTLKGLFLFIPLIFMLWLVANEENNLNRLLKLVSNE